MAQGKVAIVTGGGSGIGKASALLLAKRGHAVTVADVNEQSAQSVAEAIKAAGGEAQAIHVDVTQEADVRAMVDKTVSAYGRLDTAINCAGVPFIGKAVYELDVSEWDLCHAINMRGMFLSFRHQIPAMIQSGGGAIVAISSVAGINGVINGSEYCSSKAGVIGLVRGASVDCAEHNIRVNAVLPGGTDTPMMHLARAVNPKLAGSVKVPMGRAGKPEEVAATCVWLCSEEAGFITGASLTVDGGATVI